MSTEQIPPETTAAVLPVVRLPPPPSRRRYLPGLFGWIFGAFVLVVLIGFALPCYQCGIGTGGRQTRSMAQAKAIGFALKLYAADNDGNYPRAGQSQMLGAKPADSNAAFAVLFPGYLTSENLFANPFSAYQTRNPDNVYDQPYTGRPVKTLEPGENVYAYVTGLNDQDNARMPLIVDGTDGTGHYVTDPKKRGGVWRGIRAVVVHLDNSAALEKLRGPDEARYVPRDANPALAESIRPARPSENLLDFSSFGPDVRLLDPAVKSR